MSDPNESTQPIKATQPVNPQNPDPAQDSQESTQEIKPKPKKKLAGRIGKLFLYLLIFRIIIKNLVPDLNSFTLIVA